MLEYFKIDSISALNNHNLKLHEFKIIYGVNFFF